MRDAIRSCGDTTSLALDWRPHERAHARELAVYWSRLPAAAQSELARTWIERCERRCGKPIVIDDPTDLHQVSAKALRIARGVGLCVGDEEASAQEREVRAPFERDVGPV